VSQQQDSTILYYRDRARSIGLHSALQEACKDLDETRDALGRKEDRQSAIRFAFGVFGFCLGIITCAVKGCTTIGHEKVAGWPQLRVVEHHVPHKDMRDKCAPAGSWMGPVEACAEFRLASGECHIYYSADFPPQKWIVEHERLHCAGHDHLGSTSMRDYLARWRTK
jgi:hypothetical protein